MILSRVNVSLRRCISTSANLLRPKLIDSYKDEALWDKRFNCPMLASDESFIRDINKKIIGNETLTNYEIDTFINLTAPSEDNQEPYVDAIRLIRELRTSLYAKHLLPSTTHAMCRLLMSSNNLPTLLQMLENRIKYGLFPDFYVMNLLLDDALEKNDFASASRLAALVMIQEEFGINYNTDYLSLYSVCKYLETKTDFSDWTNSTQSQTDLLAESEKTNEPQDVLSMKSDKKDEGEDEEVEAEYIRVPFLRNPYNDYHFDLTEPSAICGKTLKMLANSGHIDPKIKLSIRVLGHSLFNEFDKAKQLIDASHDDMQSLSNVKDILVHYANEHKTEDESIEAKKKSLIQAAERIPDSDQNISDIIDDIYEKSESSGILSRNKNQNKDIVEFEKDLSHWSEERLRYQKLYAQVALKKKLKEEIEQKKKDLALKEQYLYYFDNLRKSKYRPIEYK